MTTNILKAFGTVAFAALLAIPAIAAATQNAIAQANKSVPGAWPAESLNGTISAVDPTQHLVIVKDASGVPFDMVIGKSTRIESGQREVALKDLQTAERVSIRFVPESRGDVARSIMVSGS
jgi:hypothetical protein